MPASDQGAERRARLADARLYLVCPAIAPTGNTGRADLHTLLRGAAAGGVDIVQLRDKDISDSELEPVIRPARELCRELSVLFVLNDRPALAREVDADGVHVGQDDMPVPEVRRIVGPEMLIGLSAHAREEIDDAAPFASDGSPLADYIGVGPVHATPTKPGRAAVGDELVRYASTRARAPFFAIGGLHAGNLGETIDAGARRVCVLRAISKRRGSRGRRSRAPRAARCGSADRPSMTSDPTPTHPAAAPGASDPGAARTATDGPPAGEPPPSGGSAARRPRHCCRSARTSGRCPCSWPSPSASRCPSASPSAR